MTFGIRPSIASVLAGMIAGGLIAASSEVSSLRSLNPSRLLGKTVNAAPLPAATPGLLQASDLIYQGAFRIPMGTPAGDQHSANFGGNCMTYNPATNTLLICGMDIARLVGEISIPTPVNTSNLSALPTASLVHNFVDVLGGHVDDVLTAGESSTVFLGGLLVTGGQLVVTSYVYFDTNAAVHPTSHFVASANLAAPAYIGGPYQVGNPAMPGFVAGPMVPIPAAYQASLGGPFLTGQCCLPIVNRTSEGPSVSVFNPPDLGVASPAPATRVLGYDINHHTLGDWGGNAGLWNGSSRSNGVVFPVGTRSVLFFGTLGHGNFCYGIATSNPALAGTISPTGDIYCYDPMNDGGKGPTNYPYTFHVWAYDVNDLAAVKAGTKNYYDVLPYANWDFSLPILNPVGAAAKYSFGSVAYDPVNQRLFLAQKDIDDYAGTIINVFSVQTGTSGGGLCQ